MSHPVWVRGLKLAKILLELLGGMSHPVWVRGLKLVVAVLIPCGIASHPVWVRGLKQNQYEDIKKLRDVAPRVGAWIETCRHSPRSMYQKVAPRVGAWIETSVPS